MKGTNRIPVDDSKIVDCLKRGLLPKQIGPVLGMKYRTVINRLEKLKKQMKCETLYQLVAEYGDKVAG
jgi:DNA-binding NarL/FixJ family response regulator